MTRVQTKHSEKKKSADRKTAAASIIKKMAPVCIDDGVWNFISANHSIVLCPSTKRLRFGVPFKHPVVATVINHCKELPNVYPKKFVDLLEKLKCDADQHGFMLTLTTFGFDESNPMVCIYSHDTDPDLPNLKAYGKLVQADIEEMGDITTANMNSCIFYWSKTECVWPKPRNDWKVIKEAWGVTRMANQVEHIRKAMAPKVRVGPRS